jgi:hypothetical protein
MHPLGKPVMMIETAIWFSQVDLFFERVKVLLVLDFDSIFCACVQAMLSGMLYHPMV